MVRDSEPQRLVASLAESLVARGALKPVTFVGKLWLSYKARCTRGGCERCQACGLTTRRGARQAVLLTQRRSLPAPPPAKAPAKEQARSGGGAKRR